MTDCVMHPETRLNLVLQASASGTTEGVGACEQFLTQHGVPLRARLRTALVLEEALMNIARHAHAPGGHHHTRVSLGVHAEGLELGLTDDGVPFDPLAAELPERPTSLEDALPGGLGLPFMRRFSRRMQYERIGGCNHLTMWLDLL